MTTRNCRTLLMVMAPRYESGEEGLKRRRRRESNPCTGLCRPLPKPLGHSAARAYGPSRADDGIRTRDPHLGKVMLYQLSHVRIAPRGAIRTVADPTARANSDPRSSSHQSPNMLRERVHTRHADRGLLRGRTSHFVSQH